MAEWTTWLAAVPLGDWRLFEVIMLVLILLRR
jgi:hypothetical protein